MKHRRIAKGSPLRDAAVPVQWRRRATAVGRLRSDEAQPALSPRSLDKPLGSQEINTLLDFFAEGYSVYGDCA